LAQAGLIRKSFANASGGFIDVTNREPMPLKDFEQDLARIAAATERTLETLMPLDTNSRIRNAMRYAVLGQGKRLRPFYVMASADLFDVPQAQASRVAAAIECVHCYSLAHDDLPAMDNDDLRRGQPTTHRKFDEATAILAGDGLLTFAFQILSDQATSASAEIRSALVAALSREAGEAGMVGGQMRDIEAETTNFASLEEIAAMQMMKTGALFRFSCTAGAILAGADPKPLATYAEKIGLSFQIADDLLDLRSTTAALGKATQKDQGKGKATFIDFLGEKQAEAYAKELVAQAISAVEGYGKKANRFASAAHYVIQRKK
jgi:farnesyl diphosphate synthase